MRPGRVLAVVVAWLLMVTMGAIVSGAAMGMAGRQIGVVHGGPGAGDADADGGDPVWRDTVTLAHGGDPAGSPSTASPAPAAAGTGSPGAPSPQAATPPAPTLPFGVSGDPADAAAGSGPGTSRGGPGSPGVAQPAPAAAGPGAAAASTVPPSAPSTVAAVPTSQPARTSATSPATTSAAAPPAGSARSGAGGTTAERAAPGTRAAPTESVRFGVFSDQSGQMLLACSPGSLAYWRVLPAVGWSARASMAGGSEVRVWFVHGSDVRAVVGRCEQGTPRIERVTVGLTPASGTAPGSSSPPPRATAPARSAGSAGSTSPMGGIPSAGSS